VSLETADLRQARDKAFHHDGDINSRLRNNLPVFDKPFAQVALEYSAARKAAAEAGKITMNRWKIVDGYIRLHLIPYLTDTQITQVAEDEWDRYPAWRRKNSFERPKKQRPGMPPEERKPAPPARDNTIRHELITLRAIMNFAADKNYIRERQVPRGDLPSGKARREEFTPQEYRELHTFARDKWIKKARNKANLFYRSMAYNFVLIMTNTGMRTIEAENLRWRDVDVRSNKEGRKFVVLNVSGKDKSRGLVAPESVATYLDRVRALFVEAQKERQKKTGQAKTSDELSPKPNDFVFTNYQGQKTGELYNDVIADLLAESKLLYSASGSRRSSYCFRHTYATFRLMEGVDVYFLAKQMGTSVKMIEDHYGHITPAKNAERILQGIPGWELDRGEAAPSASLKAGVPVEAPKKSRAPGKGAPKGKRSR
jgi:integrase